MNENRGRVDLLSSSGLGEGRELDLLLRAMEEQIKIQDQLVSAERNRHAEIEKTREQQELIRKNAEKDIQALRTEAADSSWSTMVEQNTREVAEARTAFAEMNVSGEKLFQKTSSSLKSFFKSVFKGELTSAKNLWDFFCGSLADSLSSALSKITSYGMKSLLGDLFDSSLIQGGGSSPGILSGLFHSGGVVGAGGAFRIMPTFSFAGAPRLHSGLGLDEFPAILQRGEMVIPKGKWTNAAAAHQSVNVEVKIDNQSSSPLKLEQGSVTRGIDKVVIGIVAKDIDENGVLGRILRAQGHR
ncbi:MAG: hypothetical protein ABFD97_14455 [Syntrophobacter sp.]